MKQNSFQLLAWASLDAFPINGDINSLVIFKSLIDSIKDLMDKEQPGEWDAYLKITFMDGTSLETLIGYTDLGINEKEEGYTSYYYTENGYVEALKFYCKISSIKSITIIPD